MLYEIIEMMMVEEREGVGKILEVDGLYMFGKHISINNSVKFFQVFSLGLDFTFGCILYIFTILPVHFYIHFWYTLPHFYILLPYSVHFLKKRKHTDIKRCLYYIFCILFGTL